MNPVRPNASFFQIDGTHKRAQTGKAVVMPIEGGLLHSADWANALCTKANCQINRFRNYRIDPDRTDILSQQLDAWSQTGGKRFDDEGAMRWLTRKFSPWIKENGPSERIVRAFPEPGTWIIGASKPPIFTKCANSRGCFQRHRNL